MKPLFATLRREWRLSTRGGGWAASTGLFVAAAGLAPLALGTDADLLAVAAPAVLWIAACLALLIGFDGLYEEDLRAGGLAVARLTPLPLSVWVTVKIAMGWATTCLPLVAVTPLLLGGFGVASPWSGTLAVAIGTPGLALLAGALGAICASLRRGAALVVFLAMPLFAPALIFGPEAARGEAMVPLLCLGAFSFAMLATCPFIGAAALRAHMA